MISLLLAKPAADFAGVLRKGSAWHGVGGASLERRSPKTRDRGEGVPSPGPRFSSRQMFGSQSPKSLSPLSFLRMLVAGADYQLPPLPLTATSVPRPRRSRTPYTTLRPPGQRLPVPSSGQGSRRRPHGSRDPGPWPPARRDPRAPPPGRKPQVEGRRGAHLSRRGALGASWRRGGGGGHVVERRRLLLPGTPLSPPRPAPPAPKCETSRRKVRPRLRNAKRGPAAPASPGVSSLCCVLCARQVPDRAGARGAGPAQVEARGRPSPLPAGRPPRRACPVCPRSGVEVAVRRRSGGK